MELSKRVGFMRRLLVGSVFLMWSWSQPASAGSLLDSGLTESATCAQFLDVWGSLNKHPSPQDIDGNSRFFAMIVVDAHANTSKEGFNLDNMVRVFFGECGLHPNMDIISAARTAAMALGY